ncbi:MAG: ribonuclease, partial [Rhodospirillales bacterium]|nr:ribonuclease [Rhodospirillales bacterium]
MSLSLRVACSPGERRVALLEGEILLDYALERPSAPDGVGDLHRGRIAAVVPAMAGAFVALEGGIQGFLPDSEGARGRAEGETVGVRVTRAAQGGKGPRLTARLDDANAARVGSGAPALLTRGPDAVVR